MVNGEESDNPRTDRVIYDSVNAISQPTNPNMGLLDNFC